MIREVVPSSKVDAAGFRIRKANENSDRTGPLAVIYRERKHLTLAMLNFISSLKQPAKPVN
jgi:hypothetical protein